jgi:hypothetical protein
MYALVPDADELLSRTTEERGQLILELLKENDTQDKAVAHSNFFNRANDFAVSPKYGGKQQDVDQSLMEAWALLESQTLFIKKPSSGGASWFYVGSRGKELLDRKALFERFDKLGLDRVKSDLERNEGKRTAHRGKELDAAWEWLRTKEGRAMLPPGKVDEATGPSYIAETRIDELRKLSSPDFDLQKLIRLCQELNSSYGNGNYYATAMLTRGILDQVPPLLGHQTFAEVANNYGGGGRSFKETMQHLEGAARKIGDGHLHTRIRKSETLPTAQQVYCASQLDALLAEIIRIMK